MAENPFLLPPRPAVGRATPPAPLAAASGAVSLLLPDGAHLAVDAPIVLGRDPARATTSPDARPVPLVDPGTTMSKTHALLEPLPEGHGLRITDLHSTNGTAIGVDGVRTVLPPGGNGVAPVGAIIELGSFTLTVEEG